MLELLTYPVPLWILPIVAALTFAAGYFIATVAAVRLPEDPAPYDETLDH
jgi:hypothetical protein